MDTAEKRVNETIQQMPDQDLYSIGDSQVASDRAREKAYTLQHGQNTGKADEEMRENEPEDE